MQRLLPMTRSKAAFLPLWLWFEPSHGCSSGLPISQHQPEATFFRMTPGTSSPSRSFGSGAREGRAPAFGSVGISTHRPRPKKGSSKQGCSPLACGVPSPTPQERGRSGGEEEGWGTGEDQNFRVSLLGFESYLGFNSITV